MTALVALDLGGTGFRARVLDGARRIEASAEHPPGDARVEFDAVLQLCTSLRDRAGVACAGGGLSSAPALDEEGRVLRWPNRPRWEGLPLLASLEECFGCPFRAEDDGDAAALAEARARGVGDLVYVGVGTGVSGGVVRGGELARGAAGLGGELGHLPLVPDGRLCACGRRGCLQAHASGPAILALAFPDDPERRSPAELHRSLASGEVQPTHAVEEAARALAQGITILSDRLSPDRIVVGGGAYEIPGLERGLLEALDETAQAKPAGPRVERAIFGAHSSLEGAVELARSASGG